MKIGYARVSSQSQADTEALNQQMSRLKNAGAEEIVFDVESGRKEERAELLKLWERVKTGAVKEIIVTRIDRLGRSVMGLHKAIALLEEHKCNLRVLDQPIDTTSSFGWLSLTQISMFAEFESRLIGDRIKHGLNYYRESGKSFGVPYGYEKTPEGILIPHPTEWDIALDEIQIYFWYEGNLTKSIAKIYEKWGHERSVPGFRNWLINPVCQGHTVYNRWHNNKNPEKWTVIYNTHPALITAEQFQGIEYLLKKRKQKWGRNGKSRTASEYPLSGQIKCGVCQGNCYRYICRSGLWRMRCRKRDEGTQRCSNGSSAKYENVEAAVIGALIEKSEEIERIALSALQGEESPELAQLRSQIKTLEAMGDNPAIEIARVGLRQQISELQRVPEPPKHFEHLRNFQNPDYWKSLPDDEKRKIMAGLVDRVYVVAGKVERVILRV
ncbi:MAG: recombinase family protein [Iphinoe sp. HA4291-MV1]|nr:recombinase family protein [Iphinoe sp. HA4291-MV1]